MSVSSSNWKRVPLKDTLLLCCGGAWGDADDPQGVGVLRTNNITDDFRLNTDGAVRRRVPAKVLDKLRLRHGDIIMTKSNSLERVGTCAMFTCAESPVQSDFIPANFCQLLRFDPGLVHPEYALYWLMQDDVQSEIKSLAVGTSASLKNVNGAKIQALQIRIPPVFIQRRLAAKIASFLDAVRTINDLIGHMTDELTALKRSLVLGETRASRHWVPLGNHVDWIQKTESVRKDCCYEFAGVRSFGKGVFRSGTRSSDKFQYRQLRRLQYKDFIYPKLMAWEGGFGMVRPEHDGLVVSPEFVVFRTQETDLLPEVLDTYFTSPECIESVRAGSTGSNKRRRRLNPREFLRLRIPMPSREDQVRLRQVYRFEEDVRGDWEALRESLPRLTQKMLHNCLSGAAPES